MEGEVIVGFPGRRNVLHFLTSEAEYVALHDAAKKLLFEDTLGVSWSPVRECHAFPSLRTIRVQCNSR